MRPPPKVAPDARLLGLAAEHVDRFGAKRATVVGVAEAAGMTHANVYRYFPSKTALVDAVVAAALGPIEARLADIAGAPDPADDKLERMILALARSYRDLLETRRHLFDAFVVAVEGNRPVARRHRGRARTLFERAIEEGISTGVFQVSDRARALDYLSDSLHRFTHPASVRLDAELPRAALDQRLRLAIRAARRILGTPIV
jgi:AcrR family transcriptional regulator